ncbi:hypothetical protein SCP_0312780 [Sparassis crispa]|uniref:Uncharacterized protein n=1 Tax=Sparassis crispa TaxID=139825 RepID=A0A401GHA2_9APHY|nr:hypothetical protein SCP_0312780 [Sparassis crispa]GBE81549.1 hypothetical protein SCP_0312780 [Sparassis crispa]
MSFPQTKKDISDRPAACSVVEPVDKQAQAADVDRKFRFYDFVTALRQSRMPTNPQIENLLSYSLEHSPVPIDQLSPAGQTLIRDAREVINTLRQIIEEKNADEVLQNFVWHTRDVDADRAKKDPNEVLPVGQDKARSDAQQATQHLRTLLSLVLTNSEVRKLISDFAVIGRNLLARGAVKIAEQTRPDQERLRQVDEPGLDNRFFSEGEHEVGLNETPIPGARIPGTDIRISQHPGEEVGQGAKIQRDETGKAMSGAEAMGQASQRKEEITERTMSEAQSHEEYIQRDVVDVPENSEETASQSKKESLQGKMTGMKDSITGRVPQEHKDRANEHVTRVKNFLSDEYFPKERREQLIFRGKKVIVECQSHEDYQGSIRWLLDTLEEYSTHGRTIAGHGKDSYQQLTSDPSLQQSTRELRTLLERFANGMSLDVIGDAMHVLYEEAQRDEQLRHWFHDLDAYIREVLLQPGYVLDEQCNEQASELQENGRRFYDERYKGHFDNLFNALTDWFGAIAQDPLNKRFGNDCARLSKDLLFDIEGSIKYKPELWSDIKQVIFPSLIANIGYLPIPRIEYTDDTLDLVLENLALSGRNLLPNVVSLETRNFLKFSPYNTLRDESHHELTLTLAQIQADMRDIAFYYRKKTGMPKVTDSGLADVLLGGSGLTVTAHIISSDLDRSSVFKIKNVQVHMDTLKFSIRDSKHDTLYKALHPLVQGLVKKQLQKVIGGAVQTALEYLDGELVTVRDQMAETMAETTASEERSRTQVLQEQLFAKKDKTEEKADTKGSQFKVVTQRGDELLPQVGRPEGWVNRALEQTQSASKGEEWRSEAFNML